MKALPRFVLCFLVLCFATASSGATVPTTVQIQPDDLPFNTTLISFEADPANIPVARGSLAGGIWSSVGATFDADDHVDEERFGLTSPPNVLSGGSTTRHSINVALDPAVSVVGGWGFDFVLEVFDGSGNSLGEITHTDGSPGLFGGAAEFDFLGFRSDVPIHSAQFRHAFPDNQAFGFVIDDLVLAADSQPSTVVTLLPRDSDWFYVDAVKNELHPAGALDYPKDAAGRSWNDPDFDMATSADRTRTPSVSLPWQDGSAPFGAGTIDGATVATPLEGIDDAPDHERNDVTTYLFRLEFDSPDPTTILGLRLKLLADDGGILYINGQEVFRTPHMTGLDPLETTTLVHDAGSESYVNYALDAVDALIEGVNSIAFELHQAELDSSDVAFDLGLTAMVVTEPSTVVGRHVFYNDSAFDGDDPAIATDKSALLAGVPATFENYTNFDGGTNGIIVDIDRLGRSGVITGTDFEFRVGNSDDLST